MIANRLIKLLNPFKSEKDIESTKTIFLHVGLHKTATTSIQLFLLKNSDILLNHYGLYVPYKKGLIGNDNHVNSGKMFVNMFLDMDQRMNYYDNRIDNKTEAILVEEEKALEKYVAKDIKQSKVNKIIFSAEKLSHFNAEALTRIKKYFTKIEDNIRIKIIFVGRNNLSFAESDIQERLKAGSSIKEKFIINKYSVLYKKHLKKFIEVFGKENIITYRFEDSIKSGNGVECFMLQKMGFEIADYDYVTEYKNEGISLYSCDFLNYVNSNFPKITKKEKVCIRGLKGPKFLLDKETKTKLYNECRADILWLNSLELDINYDYEAMNDFESMSIKFDDDYYNSIRNYYDNYSDLIKKCYFDYIEDKIKTVKSHKEQNVLRKIRINILEKA